MLRFTVTLFVIAVIAGIFSFGEIEPTAAIVGKTVFFITCLLFAISLFPIVAQRKH